MTSSPTTSPMSWQDRRRRSVSPLWWVMALGAVLLLALATALVATRAGAGGEVSDRAAEAATSPMSTQHQGEGWWDIPDAKQSTVSGSGSFRRLPAESLASGSDGYDDAWDSHGPFDDDTQVSIPYGWVVEVKHGADCTDPSTGKVHESGMFTHAYCYYPGFEGYYSGEGG